MKIALVHDYIKDYGGAERVLEALHELYPDAPIYTAFYQEGSLAYKRFKGAKIIASWAQYVPFFATKLHSPLRFLAPWIWGSFTEEFKRYDVIISSASWYITKGFGSGSSVSHPELVSGSKSSQDKMPKQVRHDKKKPIEICYCHTPPRWLYGFRTSIEWQRYWPIKVYGAIVGHFMRMYDFGASQRVDYFIANSQEVKDRIKKFYRRDATIIYPPATLARALRAGPPVSLPPVPQVKKEDYYFVVARIVGGKGLALAVEAAKKLNLKLKIAGVPAGYYTEYKTLTDSATDNAEFLGYVTDEQLVKLYAGAKAFLALSQDEDFGITPVESMSCGTPVIAYFGGGYKETVIEGKTGIFFHKPTVESLVDAIQKFEKMKFDPKVCKAQAEKFSKARFKKEIENFVNTKFKNQEAGIKN